MDSFLSETSLSSDILSVFIEFSELESDLDCSNRAVDTSSEQDLRLSMSLNSEQRDQLDSNTSNLDDSSDLEVKISLGTSASFISYF